MATNWGIVTCGKIARDFTIALQTLNPDEHKIVAVAARDLKKAEKFADDFRIPKYYGSYHALAKDSEVAVAYVATINPSHVPVCKMMMDHGKHVLCEKPLALNRKQCEELIQYAKKSNVFLMEAMWSRFNPAFKELRKVIESGKIGAVKHMNCTFGIPMQTVERLGAKKLGGGTTLDIGIYCVNLAYMTFWREKPQKVLATGSLNEDGIDWSANVILQYSGGRSAAFTYSGLVSLPNEATVTGSEGILKLKTPFWSTDELLSGQTGETLFKVQKIETPKTHFNNSYIMRYEADEVRQCLRKGKTQSPQMTWSDTLAIHSILDQIRSQLGVVYDEDEIAYRDCSGNSSSSSSCAMYGQTCVSCQQQRGPWCPGPRAGAMFMDRDQQHHQIIQQKKKSRRKRTYDAVASSSEDVRVLRR